MAAVIDLASCQIDTVFWRVKSPMLGLPSNDEDRYDADFRFREWRAAISGLNSAMPDALWLNRYVEHVNGAAKVMQLNIAAEIGLQIPATVVSNEPERVLPLFEGGEVIYKTLSNPFYSPNHMIMTSKI